MLPSLLECDQIPNVREEIPTRQIAAHYPHLEDISGAIPPRQSDAHILLLLLGRDFIDVHHILDHRIGVQGAPYAQRLK